MASLVPAPPPAYKSGAHRPRPLFSCGAAEAEGKERAGGAGMAAGFARSCSVPRRARSAVGSRPAAGPAPWRQAGAG